MGRRLGTVAGVALAAIAAGCSVAPTGDTHHGVDAEALVQARHPYIGDNSKNSAVLAALDFGAVAPVTGVSLDTDARPYSMNLTLGRPTSTADLAQAGRNIEKRAAVVLAAIDNADRITWSFADGGATGHGSLDRSQAARILGRSLDVPSSPDQLRQDAARLAP